MRRKRTFPKRIEREVRQVAFLRQQGLSVREIMRRLDISETTYLVRVFQFYAMRTGFGKEAVLLREI